MTKIELSLVIPTYNEVDIIEKSLGEIAAALGPDLSKKTEVFIVDDGTDSLNNLIPSLAKKTPFYALEYYRNSPPLGKGASIALAMDDARGEVVGYLDVDLSTPPRYIHKAIEILNSSVADVFIASRRGAGASVNREQFFLKDILGYLLYVVAHGFLFLGTRSFRDTQCGFKFFKNRAAKLLYKDLVSHDGLVDLEVLLRASLLKMNVFECGVEWVDIRESKRSLKRILIPEIISMIKILFNYKIVPGRQRKKLEERASR